MPKLKAKGLQWLKGFHLLAVSCWIGGAVSLISLYFLKAGISDGRVLYGINQSLHHVDMSIVVVPGAIGCLLTGLAYSLFSNWGFFKHTWLTVKWVVTLSAIVFGTFFLGPWESAMMEISGKLGMTSLGNSAYLYNQKMNLLFGTLQVVILMVTLFISIFKPWRAKKRSAANWNPPETERKSV